jgi:hypothetical protein
MKKFLLIALTLAVTIAVWRVRHDQRLRLATENDRLTAEAAHLRGRMQLADTARQSARERSFALRQELKSRAAAARASVADLQSAATPPVAPDASHQGGWPQGAGYLYLSKQYLTNASYQLLNGNELSDTAATLLGLSPVERAAVNQSFADLFNQFRGLEAERMERVTLPVNWERAATLLGAKIESGIVYHIPGLTADVENIRQTFSQQVEQTLGSSRAQLLEQAADSHIRQNLDDLGAGERTIGFIWQIESDGSRSAIYCIADAQHGQGSFQRIPDHLDPNSQIAYYAKTFGVDLPGPH